MIRAFFVAYGLASYATFLGIYAWLALFVGDWLLPRTIDRPAGGNIAAALAVDLLLLGAFAAQHSIMARPAFKVAWTRIVPHPIERSTYMFASSFVLALLIWFWQPIPAVIWNVQHPVGWWLLVALFIAGWLLVPGVSLMISHFDLFGLRQVWLHFTGRDYEPLPFRTPLAYAFVRHPLYIAWMLAFWATPTMTAGHLLFAVAMTGYMLAAAVVEERDLVHYFGEHYLDYRRRVPMFIPGLKWGNRLEQRRETARP
ncbi:MAG: isoprenylcysteine carboxylmethyltransferase family protein [Pirellulaceae bacterium]|nr:isoprenylcysteine carboxylmethyltransferase family protein [Pirellulaceae bacterium]